MKKKAFVCVTLFFVLFILALTAENSRKPAGIFPDRSKFITEIELQGPAERWHERELFYMEAFDSREYVKIR
ncbi:hypothetical protein GKZ89_19205 [Bacillus mangrovi]|uniref:Uncharacterized protein n=1 Tax=Metabacillus mangrovi TaxID=1491830 RepID=A0A7X2S955_9BACI|nr:hypothetical protein [Metabacillus mangrovi]MTH55525.1 hypothetical protein [Metabacillus mangrovi]